ncbi:hydantoinase B/oxoprolinase family protein [Tumidithrix elongata RA019]|uniref:Hydantoinase B/oxoprolinase family protein n=2 Tax=Tumidithrix TaxID=3088355 RepID=A0AAW9Q335_9CYAN|nr:hydantoinase B/oxoprolinase family protein [Tumidithrix elongata RA019]
MAQKWQFWIDRGGTFTDIVAQSPSRQLIVHKLLSENPDRYKDAAIQGIREIMGTQGDRPIPVEQIAAIKMGTTVATNALLERKGDRTVLLITKGFKDALRIGYQNRPDIFARQILLPEMLYEQAIEVEERYSAQGEVLVPLNEKDLIPELQAAFEQGIRACAIALMHGYRYPAHEQKVASLAREIGFTQISVSHIVSPLMKLISRGDTTVVDAYLSPILRRYVEQIGSEFLWESSREPPIALGKNSPQSTKLMFMQSNGGLIDAALFQGKNSILSGPAGGIVGAVQTSLQAGFDKIISFDMGGTSTDVAHYAGTYERSLTTEIAGVRLSTPMMAIHTVAAGGGSLISFDGARYRVGPESAGAFPGPACYRNGGGLTVTDCNVMLGKLQPDFFPSVFGANGDLPLDREIVRQKFAELSSQIQTETGSDRTPEAIAAGFLEIAVEKMASAIKKISVQRGYGVTEYALCCFGGAGGQHACAIADALGIHTVFIHPYAGVLSAYGIGLADLRVIQERSIESKLAPEILSDLDAIGDELLLAGKEEIQQSDLSSESLDSESPDLLRIESNGLLRLRYEGTDSPLDIDFSWDYINSSIQELRYIDLISEFERAHQERYGFIFADRIIIVQAIAVEVIGKMDIPEEPIRERTHAVPPLPVATTQIYSGGAWYQAPIFRREDLQPSDRISGAAIILDATGTNIVEPTWEAELTERNHLILRKRDQESLDILLNVDNERSSPIPVDKLLETQNFLQEENNPTLALPLARGGDWISDLPPLQGGIKGGKPDPVKLEIFHHLFRAIAEQMGFTLQNTSASVNIRERLDFSCAIFDEEGQLVANAPHIPVHLGSMGESVKALIQDSKQEIHKGIHRGDVFATNNPYNGGTHLPDITVITPVFDGTHSAPIFYVASRGHHADIGGITPGSMPPDSTNINQEGILFDNFRLVEQGSFCEQAVLQQLTSGEYPARNPAQNISDLQAQIAANEYGAKELLRIAKEYGLATVQTYMKHIQDNAAESVRKAIANLIETTSTSQYTFTYPFDGGCQIQVAIALDPERRTAKIDFTGTSPQQANNFNAPLAVCKAAVLYVFRTLVNDDIPLNAGCMEPLEIVVPEGCMLNPRYPAAVVAGNVETSQAIVNALYGALGVMAAAQGTMNNFTFGNAQYQYYETICGGSGAGNDFDGTDAVQTHMTNSRLTDPEVLEWRFPVILENFAIRPHSGGQGRHRGGNGVIRQIQFREPMTAAILSNHRVVPPFGLQGGHSGMTGRNWIDRQNGEVETLASTGAIAMQAGDRIIIETPGGGGFGEVSL